MRLFLLPVSTRRALIFCQQPPAPSSTPGSKPPLTDRALNFATRTWTKWERAPSGWQKALTTHGNRMLRRIPFEEWGLKTLPPLTKRRRREIDEGGQRWECAFPGAFMRKFDGRGVTGKNAHVGSGGGGGGDKGPEGVREVLERLATERQGWHRGRLGWCVALMPVTIPFALVPIIPNIPFFYLVFRAYSHYRALYGSKTLLYLLSTNSLRLNSSPQLDRLYTSNLLHATREAALEAPGPKESEIESVAKDVEKRAEMGAETVVLKEWSGRVLGEEYDAEGLQVEVERAVEQVEKAVGQAQEKTEEKKDS